MMQSFVFLIFICLIKFCFALHDYSYVEEELGWNVSSKAEQVLSNGRIYVSMGLGFLGWNGSTNATIKYRVVLLSNVGEDSQFKLSVVAWDEGIDDLAGIVWQVNKTVGMNATLALQKDGNLVLSSPENALVWESNTADIGVQRLWLTDYGALDLKNASSGTVWSSFKHPTNKMVCGQVLEQGLSLMIGDYRFSSEPSRAALYYQKQAYQIWNITAAASYVVFCCDKTGAVLQLRSDTERVAFDRGYFVYNWKSCVGSNSTTLLELQISYESHAAMATLGDTGLLTAEELSVKSSTFQGKDYCNLPNVCGPYGLCSTTKSCSCPLDSSYFKRVDSSVSAYGCQFSNGYGKKGHCQMRIQSGIDYFNNKFVMPTHSGITEDICSTNCLNSPNCTVAFYQNASRSCFLANQISSLRAREGSDYSASFKVCKEEARSRVIFFAGAAGVSGLLLLIIAAMIYMKMRKGDEGEEDDGIVSSCLSESGLERFSLKKLGELTSSFSEKLGDGAFATVYKGLLPNGKSVAVKCLNGSTQEAKDFCAELSILSRVRHCNVVQLVGFCSNKKTRALVCEYMENGSLHQWLVGTKSPALKWETRMEIAIGSAKGMAYLHEGCAERVLHLDVKPQNILLGENCCAKVADFGLSRLTGREENEAFKSTKCGAAGYLAPELLKREAIEVKTDVYSFGVVLVEIVLGKKPKELKAEDVWNLSRDDNSICISVDAALDGSFNLEEARRMLRVAALCINHEPEARPHMSSIVQMLEGNIDIPHLVITRKFFPNVG